MSVSNFKLNNFISYLDIGGMIDIYKSGEANDRQMTLIRYYLLTEPSYIIKAVEKYDSDLKGFKFEDQIRTLYELIKDVNKYDKDSYLGSMIDYYYDLAPFNKNDEAFLLYLLYHNLKESESIVKRTFDEKEICNNFIKKDLPGLDYIKKVIGILRIKDIFDVENINYNSSHDIYFKFWPFPGSGYETTRSYHSNEDKDVIFKYKVTYEDHISKVELWNDDSFRISMLINIDNKDVQLETVADVVTFKHKDIYYIENYVNRAKMIYNSENAINAMPHISEVKSDKLASFILGESEIVVYSYEGAIKDRRYIKSNVIGDPDDITFISVRGKYFEFKGRYY